jgi:hypothetical protein
MVRARPPQNHGERDPHGRVQRNLTQYGGIIFPKPSDALVSTLDTRGAFQCERPDLQSKSAPSHSMVWGMVEMSREFSETRSTREKFACEKSETEATYEEQTVVELVSCICIFCLFASQD